MLTVGSLFSGIGGIDLGLERAGMRVVWQSETDPYASKVLKKHWPDVPNLGDITKIDWENDGLDYGDGIARSLYVDLVCGGFPCQPVSTAGRRRGQADERWLWPEVARCLRHLRPRWALLENVPGLLVQPMGDVLGDLATLGYDTEWQGIPAAAVGAPHLRWRIFIVAHTRSDRLEEQRVGGPVNEDSTPLSVPDSVSESVRVRPGSVDAQAGAAEGREEEWERVRAYALDGGSGAGDVADPGGERRLGRGQAEATRGQAAIGSEAGHHPAGGGTPLRDVGDADRAGLEEQCRPGAVHQGRLIRWEQPEQSGWWGAEPDVGRMAHGIPRRVDRLRCLGNAVVPQVAEYVGRQLLAHIQPACSCGCHAVIQSGLVPCPRCAAMD